MGLETLASFQAIDLNLFIDGLFKGLLEDQLSYAAFDGHFPDDCTDKNIDDGLSSC